MEIIDPLSPQGSIGPQDPIVQPAGPELRNEEVRSEGPALPKEALQPAGFIRRAVAFVIDFFIIEFLYLILIGVGVLGVHKARSGDFFPSESVLTSLATPFVAVWFFLFFAYFTFFHFFDGQTPAKMIVRIKVVSEGGGPLSFSQAAVRPLGYFISGFFFGFGFLFSIFERKKRALHDLLVRSYVVLA